MSKNGKIALRRMETPVLDRPASQLHAETIQCGLQDRTIGGLVDLRVKSWRVVLLQSGGGELQDGPMATQVVAPALIWQPWGQDQRLRAQAGTVGGYLLMGEHTLANAIGRKPEAADLRLMAGARVVLPLQDQPTILQDVGRAFDLILREAAAAAPGAETVIEAQVRVLLVILWRHAAAPEQLHQASPSAAQTLAQFRQMLEIHFRDRWPVARYGAELGMSADRLRDICMRTLRKTPLRLIHERSAYEAQLLLERSTQTVDQIAAFLGFRSAGQFSKFFKLQIGMAPGTYRRRARKRELNANDVPLRSYGDWP